MKRATVCAAAVAAAVWGGATTGFAADQETARLYYDDGVTFETPQFDLRLNLLLQPGFTYTDVDQDGARSPYLREEGADDTSSFDVRRAKLELAGNAMGKGFSYMIENDFASDDGGSELEDAWVQWNSDGAKLRLGQTRVPYSRQERTDDSALQFPERTVVSDLFSPKRQLGALVHGAAGEGGHYWVGAFNGDSTVDGEEEGMNRRGVDNNLLFAASIDYSSADYGSRGYEGDLRGAYGAPPVDRFGFTAGFSVLYGEGEGGSGRYAVSGVEEELGDDLLAGADFEKTALNGDLGFRYSGLSLQGEVYYSHLDLSGEEILTEDQADDFGFYVQAGWLLREDLELAGRYGYFDPDEDFGSTPAHDEYSLGVNYYLDGHELKVQTAVTWSVTEADGNGAAGSSDTADLIVDSQLSGRF